MTDAPSPAHAEAIACLAPEAEAIVDECFGPDINSATRLPRLLVILPKGPPSLFWEVFNGVWSSCDDTWERTTDLLIALRRVKRGHQHLPAESRAFLNGLPDVVRVYRGCSVWRIGGISWTTDRAVAERFAKGHRNIPVLDPVLCSADIPKERIFTVVLDREENEIVLDPSHLRSLRVALA